jgi:hypothetical protein
MIEFQQISTIPSLKSNRIRNEKNLIKFRNAESSNKNRGTLKKNSVFH